MPAIPKILLGCTPAERAALVRSLPEPHAEWLNWAFGEWAHGGQLAPAGDWRTWVLMAGRGFGKTRAGAEWVSGSVRSQGGPAVLGDVQTPLVALRRLGDLARGRLPRRDSILGAVDDLAEEFDVGVECPFAGPCDRRLGPRPLADDALFDAHVAGGLERGEVGSEVAIRGTRQGFQPVEVEGARSRRIEAGHDLQPHRLMDQSVGLGHADRSQSPLTTRPPPPTAAIQNGRYGPKSWKPTKVSAIIAAPMNSMRGIRTMPTTA